MKKLGLIGGIGPASTVDYYTGIIEGYRAETGGVGYPKFLIDNVDMTEMLSYVEKHDYPSLIVFLMNSLIGLKSAGAEIAAIASNTPHVVYEELATRTPIPVIGIVDATVDYALMHDFKNVLLLGTKFTMQNGFYPDAFAKKGIACTVPCAADIERVHGCIFPKLEDGIVDENDKAALLALIKRYVAEKHVDAIVLGCTELPLMIKQRDLHLPVIDTTTVHVKAIVKEMIKA